MYLVLVICFLYVLWTIAQIALPDRIPFDLKMIVFVDVIFSGLLTIMLLIAYCFFAGGFGGKSYLIGMGYGYCFWLAVASSIASFSVVLISGLSWYRNN
uniref:MARVEL domain-containing protein n=1 Tax=Caenorhabditis tropicalis TaxID=1561998 RepID=A0A1I7T8R0_9PELO